MRHGLKNWVMNILFITAYKLGTFFMDICHPLEIYGLNLINCTFETCSSTNKMFRDLFYIVLNEKQSSAPQMWAFSLIFHVLTMYCMSLSFLVSYITPSPISFIFFIIMHPSSFPHSLTLKSIFANYWNYLSWSEGFCLKWHL